MSRQVPFIEFRQQEQEPCRKTKRWDVTTRGDGHHLGLIEWRNGWRRYVYTPTEDTLYDALCLRQIADFVEWATCARAGERSAAQR